MKQIVSNYTYSPATNVVTLTGVNIDQDQLLLVVAPQVGRTMYNFASGVTATVSAGADTRVTLNASTAGLTTTSPLVIFYDDQSSTQTVAGTVTANNSDALTIVNSSAVTKGDVKFTAIAGAYNPTDVAPNYILNPISVDAKGISYVDGQYVNYRNSCVAELQGQGGPAWKAQLIASSVTVSNSVTIGSLPAISGTVTVGAMPSGALTTRFGTPTTANTAFATSAVTNASRKYLLIQNVTTGSNVITVGIGFTPTTTQGIQLTAGAGITFESSYIPTGAVYVLSSVTASNFTILEA